MRRRTGTHKAAVDWDRAGGTNVVAVTLQIIGTPQQYIDAYCQRGLRERYNKRNAVVMYAAHKAKGLANEFAYNWLTWENLKSYEEE